MIDSLRILLARFLWVLVLFVPLLCGFLFHPVGGVNFTFQLVTLSLFLVFFLGWFGLQLNFFLLVSLLVGSLSLGFSTWCCLNQVQFFSAFYFDWINLPFIFLTSLFFPYILVSSLDSVRKNKIIFCTALIMIEVFLLSLFSTNNFFVFYVLFELTAFPMFLLIGSYGSQPARIPAAYKFFIYTFVGSIFMLVGLLALYYFYGSCNFDRLAGQTIIDHQEYFFFFFFFALAVKIPMYPFHLWLPEAHVEAPTGVSVLLAALLLKTGGYGFIRFIIPLFPAGVHFWSTGILTLATISIILASFWALVQTDMKKMVAYSSVAHMNVCMLGIFCDSILSLQASVYMMMAHAFASAGLFTGIGIIYDRYHTRNIRACAGLTHYMPNFSFFYFFLILGNFSFPFTGNFTSEFIIFMEMTTRNKFISLIAGWTVFLSSVYSIWYYSRVFNGPPVLIIKYQDLTPREYASLFFCFAGLVFLGFYGWEYAQVSTEDYSRLLRFSTYGR